MTVSVSRALNKTNHSDGAHNQLFKIIVINIGWLKLALGENKSEFWDAIIKYAFLMVESKFSLCVLKIYSVKYLIFLIQPAV